MDEIATKIMDAGNPQPEENDASPKAPEGSTPPPVEQPPAPELDENG